jgi:hypothetical protein
MTAPSAAQLPLPTRPLPVRPLRSRRTRNRARRSAGVAAVLLLASTATGCVTVHGATELVPAATRAAAAKALARFVTTTNQANIRLDAQLNSTAETGALGALDGAGITSSHAISPAGNPHYRRLQLSDSKFLIPRQRGWPKWFAVDTAESRDSNRWLLVFTHDHAAQPWRASYLVSFPADQDPKFATDQAGYALPVPADSSGLAVRPDALSAAYAAYLQKGDQGSTAFADGPFTSQERVERRTKYPHDSQAVSAFADEAADPAHYPPAALRLADGGALVFFTNQFQVKETVANGPVNVSAATKALMTGTPNKSITLYEVSEQAVTVPTSGKVAFLDQIRNVVYARGQ